MLISILVITGATVAVQQEDGGSWIHCMIVKPNNGNHRIFLYHMSDEDWHSHHAEF